MGQGLRRLGSGWVAVLVAALLVPPSAAATISEFPIPSRPGEFVFARGIAAGPDGAMWFAGEATIGRITTAGSITVFPSFAHGGIAAGPDGAMWFTKGPDPQIGRITTAGSITSYSIPTASSDPEGIAAGPDGALWFTETRGNKIGRITTAGSITEFPLPTAIADPEGIAAGPDGALWFTERSGNKIGRITTAGSITEFPIPTALSQPVGIAAGPDGALWFTESRGNKIGRITTSGAITEYPLRFPLREPGGIAAGPDGALWFTEDGGARIGRITTTGALTEFRIPVAFPGPGLFGLGASAAGTGTIAAGPDGALWFTQFPDSEIGRITTDQAPTIEDSVTGDLHIGRTPCPTPLGCGPSYFFDAWSEPGGENAAGDVLYVTGERFISIDTGIVSCLSVDGNRATIGVRFTPNPYAALIFLEDNGPVADDRFAVQRLPTDTPPFTCPADPPAGLTLGPAFSGAGAGPEGVVVTDEQPARPVPTSKDDCKRGGYRQFGFRNQGQCIASLRATR